MEYELGVHLGGLQASNQEMAGSALAKLLYEQTEGSKGDIMYHMSGSDVVYEFLVCDGMKEHTVSVSGRKVEVKYHG